MPIKEKSTKSLSNTIPNLIKKSPALTNPKSFILTYVRINKDFAYAALLFCFVNVITVISDGAPRRMGGPQYPVPLLTYTQVLPC